MRYRHAYIEDNKVLADSGTEVIDIRVKDPITELLVQVFATNHTSGNVNSPIARCVSKIEIVDGSDVLYSMSGHQAIATAWFDSGIYPSRKVCELWGWNQIDHFPIRFGRFEGDLQLAFDPTKFTNPQLKITWNLATVNIVDTDGFAGDSARLTVIAKVMEEAGAAPTGFLMNKEHYAFTTADSGDENIDLPTDYPYRKLLVRSYIPGNELMLTLTQLKLSVDQDKFVPFDLRSTDLARMMVDWFGVAHSKINALGNNGETRELWMDGEMGSYGNMAGTPSHFLMLTDTWAGRVTMNCYDQDGTVVTNGRANIFYFAPCVESCFCYPFGRQDLIEEAFQAPDFGSVRLVLTQDVVSAAASVVLQQIRSY